MILKYPYTCKQLEGGNKNPVISGGDLGLLWTCGASGSFFFSVVPCVSFVSSIYLSVISSMYFHDLFGQAASYSFRTTRMDSLPGSPRISCKISSDLFWRRLSCIWLLLLHQFFILIILSGYFILISLILLIIPARTYIKQSFLYFSLLI